jgi:hypothetical protein
MKRLAIAASLLISILFAAPSLLACACCVDPGYYSISTAKPSDYELSYISDIKFDKPAFLYESEAGFDGIKGLDSLKKEEEAGRQFDLNVVAAFLGKSWNFKLGTSTGAEGTISLPMPKTMVRFKVDLHENAPGTETYLYKELRFKGVVPRGTGIFGKDIVRGTSYFLVFQGHGNGCDSSADYTYWRLELSGPRADYAFYGKVLQ